MNRVCCLLLVCCGGNLVAQTNSPWVSRQLFSTPQVRLRSLNPEPDRPTSVVTDDSRGLPSDAALSQDFLLRPEAARSGKPKDSFEAMSGSGGPTGFPWAIYERLERGGYLTRPELPTGNRLERLVVATFVPEVIQWRKVSVSCSIVTAIKRRNPLCLLNPIFLDVRW